MVWLQSFNALSGCESHVISSVQQKAPYECKPPACLVWGAWNNLAKHKTVKTMARFLSRSKLRLCSANHRAGYFSNLACDWLSIVWAYSKQEIKKRAQATQKLKKKILDSDCEAKHPRNYTNYSLYDVQPILNIAWKSDHKFYWNVANRHAFSTKCLYPDRDVSCVVTYPENFLEICSCAFP